MKVLNVNKFHYLRGGAERYFFALADLLREKGHEVIPFSMQHPKNLPTPYAKYFPGYVEFGKDDELRTPLSIGKQASNGLRVLQRMFWARETARKFDMLLKDTKPDLVHIHNIYHQLSPSFLSVAKRHSIPVVMTVHDYKLIWPEYLLCGYAPGVSSWRVVWRRCVQHSYTKSFLTFLEWNIHKWLRVYEKNIDLFIVPSHFVRDVLVQSGQEERKIVVLPHFTESESSTPPPALKKWEEPTVLFFGRLSKEKGVDILLEIMHNKGLNGTLRIAGTGPEEKELRIQSEKSGTENVVFLGHLGKAELRREIRKAWCTVFPSVVPETFGLSLLESFAQGTPVVASRIGAFPELIEEGKTGLLASPGSVSEFQEKLEDLLQNSRRREAMGMHAERHARTAYSKETHAGELFKYYRRILRQ